MRYKLLGRSGLRVSELCLGTMTFGDNWGWGASRDDSQAIFNAFVDAGGNFIDTANRYTDGTSEQFVGEFIRGQREQLVVATKYSLNTRSDDPNAGGNHRKNLVQSLEASLKRLGTDYVDLLWVHAWDPLTPAEETLRALDDVVRAGKVLYVGISDTPAWVIAHSVATAELRGWSRFVGLQTKYSLIERTSERELLPMAEALGLGVTAWGPLGSGVLTGKYKAGQKGPADSRLSGTGWGDDVLIDRNYRIAAAVEEMAKAHDRTPAQVALAWLRMQPVPVIPILGARRAAQIIDNLGCLDVALSPDDIAALEAASSIELGFPHDFLASARSFVYGNTIDRIDSGSLRVYR